MPADSLIKYGSRAEAYVAGRFRKAGFHVVRSPKSRGVFDLVATRDALTVMVQVKARSNVAHLPSRPYAMHTAMMEVESAPNTVKLLWCRCPEYGVDRLTKMFPGGFERVEFGALVS
jgi:hypothetical protein